MKRISIDKLRGIARSATDEALSEYKDVFDKVEALLLVSEFVCGDKRVFLLYIPGDRPEDARMISRTRIDCYTGKVQVEVFLKMNPTGILYDEMPELE